MSNFQEYSPSKNAKIYAAMQREGADVRSLLTFPEDSIIQRIEFQPKKKKKQKNHTKSNMKMLKEVQMKRRNLNEEQHSKMLNDRKKEQLAKEIKFNHIKAKVFEDKTATTVNKTPVVPSPNKSKFHKNYGQIPEYILQFRIAEANKENGQIERLDSSLKRSEFNTTSKSYMNKQEKIQALKQLTSEEASIKEKLNKMPFGIQSDQSIQKRKKTELELQRIRREILNFQH